MFEHITKEDIDTAADYLSKKGVPKEISEKHIKYWVTFKDGRELPYKELTRTAYRIRHNEELEFKSAKSNRNEFIKKFNLELNDHPQGINFFALDELEYFRKQAGKAYNPNDSVSIIVRDKLFPIFRKTKVWACEVSKRLDGFEVNGRLTWQNWNKFRAYSWLKISSSELEEENVFFTVGVDSGSKKGVPLSLVIKIDCQWENITGRKLPHDISEKFRSFLEERIPNQEERFKTILAHELEGYSWNRLIDETVQYVRKYKDVYEDAVKLVQGDLGNEKRVARICWNSNGWVEPSGPFGKSTDSGTHEGKYGYGHEEWLFNPDISWDGFQYGFLEPIRQNQHTYQGKKFDIWLYTIDGQTKERFHIGEIRDVEVLSQMQSKEAQKKIFNKQKTTYMKSQVLYSGAVPNSDSKWEGVDVLNIRFKWEDKKLFLDEPIMLSKQHPVQKINRYTFAHYNNKYKIDVHNDSLSDSFNNHVEPNESDSTGTKYIRDYKLIEVKETHKEISLKLIKLLKEQYGKQSAKKEFLLDDGKKVDITVRLDSGFTFYEIKTYNSIRYSIREAFGQLLEYCFWPNDEKANELIIITPPEPDIEEAKMYLDQIRKKTGLNIWLQTFDLKNDELSEKF